jgi:NADH-quinone oxidoreductase subunit N
MSDFAMILPLVFLSAGGIAILLGDVHGKGTGARPIPPAIALLCCLAAWISFAVPARTTARGHEGFVLWDAFGTGAGTLILLCAAVTVALASDYFKKADANYAEVYALILFAAAGMTVMVLSDHFVSIFLGLEIMSLSLYVLCSVLRGRATSTEAGLKYFLAGSFASGVFLMGLALLYGAVGRLDVAGAAQGLAQASGTATAGATLVLVGFAFKLSLVPFHQWAPDVYEGAPTSITGFMSTAVKVAGFAAFFRVVQAYGPQPFLHSAMVWLAIATMIVGNLGALAQKSVKRMLAYSSVGHAGYLMLAPISAVRGSTEAAEAMLVYLAAYALTNLLAFGALSFFETREGGGLTFDDLKGARWRRPAQAAALIVAMLSLAGAPPTAGFLGKFRVFGAAVERGLATGDRTYFWLVGVGIVTSLISLGYYLKVIVAMCFTEPDGAEPARPRFSGAHRAVLLGLAGLVIWLGVGPTLFGFGAEGLFNFAKSAAAPG